MKTLKSSKSKGFTLIELMVVISIIALLSSVVLASVKTARERAQITKTVAEMKSMQNALELYRNQFGLYPLGNKGDDDSNNYDSPGLIDGLDSFVKSNLVDNKFISKVPHAPNYPNNCNGDCPINGHILAYSTSVNFDEYGYGIFCGTEKAKNYVIFLMTNSKVNLPILDAHVLGTTIPENNYGSGWLHAGSGLKAYCLSM